MDDDREEYRAYWLRQLRGVVQTLESNAFRWDDSARVRWVIQQLRFLIDTHTPEDEEPM